MKNFFKELLVRIKSETPEFFKKLRTLLLTVGAISSAMVESGVSIKIYGFNVAQILAITSVTASVITFLAVKDGSEVKKEIEDIKNGKK